MRAETPDLRARIEALVDEYENRAANDSARYARACDVVDDIRAALAETEKTWDERHPGAPIWDNIAPDPAPDDVETEERCEHDRLARECMFLHVTTTFTHESLVTHWRARAEAALTAQQAAVLALLEKWESLRGPSAFGDELRRALNDTTALDKMLAEHGAKVLREAADVWGPNAGVRQWLRDRAGGES